MTTIDPLALSCPVPIPEGARVTLGHGSGGQLSGALMRDVLAPCLAQASPGGPLNDAAVLDLGGTQVAFTTDSFVVSPVVFPGGDIAELAVNGTINDLAMMGAQPAGLSLAFVIEEGLTLEDLGALTASAARAAAKAGTSIVTGDTKVVGRGAADQLFVNTAGVGVVPAGVQLGADRARPGDVILLSGPIGLHGVAIMSVREGLEFEAEIASDTQPLNRLVAAMLAVEPGIKVLRDPTRGGLASALNEIAETSRVGMVLDDAAVPIPDAVRGACEMLGLDPYHVANEGKLVAVVPADSADRVLDAMRALPEGEGAVRIGAVVADHPGMVTAKTLVGSERIVDMLVGEQLPRIC
ncbi:hydrogenase expression/formation protein HypE [Isoptericola sp. b441]|uniref:Hydrogenase expression/formation protein HypE n=1 Tax=Actinotalea lenta TaxID=3064654 RepID=A0ABT9DC54_9CELL|nr:MULTISPECIES: hydrogenase expression/formation protein HypE [unclassified Isoptericola]MDO8108483.1 hydrogenase expression/formation protein HypE [Isoptericola sp. b441]MDO8119902.1 hydrogenase expression/formation protein HypE [Isoptericola sp. b490]